MDVNDKLLLRGGLIANLNEIIEDWFSTLDSGIEVDFEVLCNEYQKKGGKIMDSFSKYFEKPKDLGEVFTYLFDLDIHGWNVSIAYFDNRKLVTIALERPIA